MRAWLLALALFSILPSALAADDLERDLRELQQQAEGLLNNLQRAAPSGAPGGQQLDTARRKIFALASDQRFLRAMNDLWASPKRNELLVVQLVFFVLMLLLRAWRQSRAANWFTRLLVGFGFTVVMWAGMLYGLPALILGEPFRVFVNTLVHVLFSAH